MDDDVEWIENMASMDFHPCDTPRGMMYYNMDVLTKEQQHKLNSLKIRTLKDNQKYLASHPEIRACVSIITKLVLKQRPRTHIHETIAEYFSKSRVDIESDVHEYLRAHKPKMYGPRSHLDMFRNPSDFSSYESESSLTTYSSTSSVSSITSLKDSSMWKMDIPEIDVETLQMDVSGSLRNIGIEYEMIRNMGSETPMHSISIVTQPPEDEERGIRTTSIMKPEHITINEYLKELESISYADMMEGEMENEGPYRGHIPRLEDYDAGYGRRRQTFEAGQVPMDEIEGPIADYMAEMETMEDNRSDNVEDFPLESRTSNESASHTHIRAERIRRTSLDQVTKGAANKHKLSGELDESEMKALMSRRSVRISGVGEEDLKEFEKQMDEKKQSRRSKDDRKSQDDSEKRVRTSLDERNSKAKSRAEKANDQSNRLHQDSAVTTEEGKVDAEGAENVEQRSLGSDHREEEGSRKSVDQKSRVSPSRVRRVSLASPDEQEAISKYSSKSFKEERPSVHKDERTGSIESTIKHQFDPSFKSVSHMRDKDDEPKSKSNIYFSKNGELNDTEGSDRISISMADSVVIRSRLEQKVSFGVDLSSNADSRNLAKSETS